MIVLFSGSFVDTNARRIAAVKKYSLAFYKASGENDLELKPRAWPVVKPCSSDKLPLLLYDWLSRKMLKDRSGYKPFLRSGSQGGVWQIRRREAKAFM
ncbi:MAG: hypothetical protein ACP5OU_04870 [Methanothrix sp.]